MPALRVVSVVGEPVLDELVDLGIYENTIVAFQELSESLHRGWMDALPAALG